MRKEPIRIYLCDDSAVARLAFRRLLQRAAGFTLVGEASRGQTALREIPRLEPDLVLMDAVMPPPDGIEITRRLLGRGKFRILMISDLAGRDARLGFKALEAGALDLLRKPSRDDMANERHAARWLRRLSRFADVPLVTRRRPHPQERERPGRRGDDTKTGRVPFERLAIGVSTGGPPALLRLLSELGPETGWPVFVVQHITPGFTSGLAQWLTDASGVDVRVAQAGDVPKAGVVYLAPENRHLVWRPGPTPAGRLALDSSQPKWGHRPSADVLFQSLADGGVAAQTCAIVLTGMGRDGAESLLALRREGAWTLAQDEASSTVWGMPKAAIDLGAAAQVVALEDLGRLIRAAARGLR